MDDGIKMALLQVDLDAARERHGSNSLEYRRIKREIQKLRKNADKVTTCSVLAEMNACVGDALSHTMGMEGNEDMNGKQNSWTPKKMLKADKVPVNALARELGLSSSTVSCWIKRKRNPREASMLKLANYLQVPYAKAVAWLEDRRIERGDN